jgi:hypothetical protein
VSRRKVGKSLHPPAHGGLDEVTGETLLHRKDRNLIPLVQDRDRSAEVMEDTLAYRQMHCHYSAATALRRPQRAPEHDSGSMVTWQGAREDE